MTLRVAQLRWDLTKTCKECVQQVLNSATGKAAKATLVGKLLDNDDFACEDFHQDTPRPKTVSITSNIADSVC